MESTNYSGFPNDSHSKVPPVLPTLLPPANVSPPSLQSSPRLSYTAVVVALMGTVMELCLLILVDIVFCLLLYRQVGSVPEALFGMMGKGVGFYLLFVSVPVFMTIRGYHVGMWLLTLASVPVYVHWMTYCLLGLIPVTLDVVGGAASFRLSIWLGIFAGGMILFAIIPVVFCVIAHRIDLRQKMELR